MKLSEKQILIIKIALGIMFAEYVGESIGSLASDFQYPNSWISGFFLISFFPLCTVLIMQWIILSEHLPKWWMIAGFIGCFLSALVVDRSQSFFISKLALVPYLEILRYWVMGLFITIPQGLLLKGNSRFIWVLGNGFGWILIPIFTKTFSVLDSAFPQIYYFAPPTFMVLDTLIGRLALGLLLGFCLHKITEEARLTQLV